jgi:hypothetical protein
MIDFNMAKFEIPIFIKKAYKKGEIHKLNFYSK